MDVILEQAKMAKKEYVWNLKKWNYTGNYCGFLTNELRVASFELRVIIYCTSYELIFTHELRVTIYCTSYELVFAYELRFITYCTSTS